MEMPQQQQQQRVQKPPTRRGYDYPSFSSSLLDSIYRSIDDESSSHRQVPDPTKRKFHPTVTDRWVPPVNKPKPHRGAPEHHHHPNPKKKPSASGAHHHHHYFTSSSSDCSSYGGFSSSEPESNSTRLKTIRTAAYQTRYDSLPPPIPLQTEKKTAKKNLNAIRSRFRDLKKARSPTSPAARLAGFLNSIFTTSKPKTAAAAVNEESACSTASSFSRSCLVKTPSMSESHAVKRSVRFQLPVDGGIGRREESRYGYGRRERMTWRDFEDDDVASDSSSDLFELENLTAVSGRYRDELPVYETTHIGGLVL